MKTYRLELLSLLYHKIDEDEIEYYVIYMSV